VYQQIAVNDSVLLYLFYSFQFPSIFSGKYVSFYRIYLNVRRM